MTKKGFSITDDLEAFRQGSFDVLAGTNAIARGVDVSHVGVVISVGVPQFDYEMFMHRVGRTGRYGTDGLSVTLMVPDEAKMEEDMMEKIENHYKFPIEKLENIAQLKEIFDVMRPSPSEDL